MYEQTKAARAAEIAAENKAGASHRDGKKIGKVVAVERTLEGGKAVKFGRDEIHHLCPAERVRDARRVL